MSDWKPIETAPKDGTWILVTGDVYDPLSDGPPHVRFTRWVSETTEHWEQVSARRQELVSEDTSHWDCCDMQPTHWMPLPNPPSDVSRAQKSKD